MFANFYDENKTREENQKEFEKARHNKECTAHIQVCVALFAGVLAAGVRIIKLAEALKD